MAAGGRELSLTIHSYDEEAVELGEEEDGTALAEISGMAKFDDWGDIINELFPYDVAERTRALKKLREAARAVCYVQRTKPSPKRVAYHEKMARNTSLPETARDWHKGQVAECKKQPYRPRRGTGLLFKADRFGAVITNNHVVMDGDEDARVCFDFDEDSDDVRRSPEDPRWFDVEAVMVSAARAPSKGDHRMLDYSVLMLKDREETRLSFLREHVLEDQVVLDPELRLSKQLFELEKLEGVWQVMVSHPRGKAKRLSKGRVSISALSTIGAVSHVSHNLPTSTGSSGGSIFCYMGGKWLCSFMHYRTKRAVSWNSIARTIQLTVNRRSDD